MMLQHEILDANIIYAPLHLAPGPQRAREPILPVQASNKNGSLLGLVCDLKIRVAPHSRTDRKESVALCDKVAQKCYFLSRTRKLNIISHQHGNGSKMVKCNYLV